MRIVLFITNISTKNSNIHLQKTIIARVDVRRQGDSETYREANVQIIVNGVTIASIGWGSVGSGTGSRSVTAIIQ